MNQRTFLYLLGVMSLIAGLSCSAQPQTAPGFQKKEVAPKVWQLGRLEPASLTESSGVVGCRFNTNVFWTHNDGHRQTLYAITRTGSEVAEFTVDTPRLRDWEDIANDAQGHLYVADIGNNNAVRSELAVYQFDEPDPQKSPGPLKVNASWKLHFPGKPFDCESLFIWKDYGYVISKVFNDESAEIYRFPLTAQKEPFVLEFVAKLPVTSPVTGADISLDGKQLALVCKSGAYLFQIDGEVSRAGIVTPSRVKFRMGQIEGCCFVPEGVLATSEKREIFLFTNEAFKTK
jgi:hypothetical protein